MAVNLLYRLCKHPDEARKGAAAMLRRVLAQPRAAEQRVLIIGVSLLVTLGVGGKKGHMWVGRLDKTTLTIDFDGAVEEQPEWLTVCMLRRIQPGDPLEDARKHGNVWWAVASNKTDVAAEVERWIGSWPDAPERLYFLGMCDLNQVNGQFSGGKTWRVSAFNAWSLAYYSPAYNREDHRGFWQILVGRPKTKAHHAM
jgi:hypothetical protein